ncbi:MAG: Alpha/Beta hydrolase protein [Monoraphidium minutum]|nr:MAG: Alpha/Beta hydrolase protein [Monoraphidium minutum]
MMPVYRDLSRLLRVNLMAYDYTGYGPEPSGLPNVSNALADVAAVFTHLKERHGVRPEDVVLYGQSVGSGPTSWLAVAEPSVAGVVLHSPLMSGVRVLQPNVRFWPGWLDIFPNHLLVPRIRAPLLVLHGTADEVIHVSAGERLAALAPNGVPPLLAQGFDHQNVECCPDYLPRLREFLAQLFPDDYGLPSARRQP